MAFLVTAPIVDEQKLPIATLVASPEYAVLGSVVTVDGRLSSDPGSSELGYFFSFVSVPIGSKVAQGGFKVLDDVGAMASFAPDVVGKYVVSLTVSNGVFESTAAQMTVDVRAIMVPHARGLVPDGKFIWSYLRDVWTQVDGKEFFETLWSALIQVAGSELLKLYQVDFNKSIRDIQDVFQRRWLKYEPRLHLADDCSFFLGNHRAGRSASTGSAGDSGLAIVTGRNELLLVQGTIRPDLAGRQIDILYSRSPENVGSYIISGTTAKSGGFRLTSDLPKNPTNTAGEVSDVVVRNINVEFEFGSTTWSMGVAKQYDFVLSQIYGFDYFKSVVPPGLDDVRVGDVAVITSGVNAGLYRIIERSGAYIIVDKAPAGASTSGESSAVTIYRPVGYNIPAVESSLSDTISVPLSEADGLANLKPGRLIVVNNRAYTISRVATDSNQRVPILSVSVDQKEIAPGLRGLPWRVPHTLVSKSQNFEELGVCPGDQFVVAVAQGDVTLDVPCQVVGVDRYRLGFVFSNEELTEGELPEIPPSFLLALANRFGVEGVTRAPDQSLLFSKEAKDQLSYLGSIFFQRRYWNTELTADSEIEVGKRVWRILPKAVVRNRLIPVDGQVRSIPALQEYISQPETVEENGTIYMVRGEKRFALPRKPVVLGERSHFLVDNETAIEGEMTFRTGTDVIDVEGGDFIDLGLRPGDVFQVKAPASLAGDYPIVQVISRNRLKLARPISRFPLSLYVAGTVAVRRKTAGRFIRIIPGLFTAKNQAPDRFWAEVSYFDNGENIEKNFGILVGLTQADLEATTSQATYRQAVAGLMYAYVNGPAVDKIRLGASLLLGLPFTEKRGIIRSIDTAFKKDTSGNATQGRIVVEDIDEAGVAQGLSRVYTFPVDPISELSGVDTNPATDKPYVVGDVVEAYASLANGVRLDDFTRAISSVSTAQQLLQRYHSARVRINDNIFQPEEVQLVSNFLRKITPSYVALVIANTSEFQDPLAVVDRVKLNLSAPRGAAPSFVDTAGLNLPLAAIYDLRSMKGIYPMRWDDAAYVMLRAGSDLVISSSGNISLASGGFLNPRANELFEAPLVRVGDKLLIADGPTSGLYPITGLTDSTLTIDGPQLSAKDRQHYAVFRALTSLARSGSIAEKLNQSYTDPDTGKSYPNTQLDVEAGLRADMVAPGDILTTDQATRHTVLSVVRVGSMWSRLLVSPLVPSGAYDYCIWRNPTFSTPLFPVTDGVLPPHLAALADVGDEIQVQQDDQFTAQVDSTNPVTVSPALPSGTYDVKLRKPGIGDTPLLFEQTLRCTTDKVKVTLRGGNPLANAVLQIYGISPRLRVGLTHITTFYPIAVELTDATTGQFIPGTFTVHLELTPGAYSGTEIYLVDGPVIDVTLVDGQLDTPDHELVLQAYWSPPYDTSSLKGTMDEGLVAYSQSCYGDIFD